MIENIVKVKGQQYRFITDYKDDEALRASFNELAEKSFGISFEDWYQQGYWGEGYIPYSIACGDKIVANVSASLMKISIDGQDKTYIQIGTVMTEKDYRGRGLSKALIEKLIEDWENKCDSIYLFANDSVLNFYPKFGFIKCNEYQCIISARKHNSNVKVRQLNLEDIKDKEILQKILDNKISISRLNVKDNNALIMFYCMDFLKKHIYYIERYNTIAICYYEKNTLIIQDIFTTQNIELDSIINILMLDATKKIVLGFTPINNKDYEEIIVDEEDTTLFIRGDECELFESQNIMFPVLSHA